MTFEDLVSATLGLLLYSKEKADELIDILVDKGEMQRDEARKLVNRMMEKGKAEKEQMREKFDSIFKDRFITKEDFRRLENKLDELIALIKEKQ